MNYWIDRSPDRRRLARRSAATALPAGLLVGAALGAGLMYLLDPSHGRARQARLRDKLLHGTRVVGRTGGRTLRDLGNRARGVVAEARRALRREEVDAATLAARVRSALGRVVSDPRALEVTVREGGRVRLQGGVPAHERAEVLSATRAVPGVDSVEDFLDELAEPAEEGAQRERGDGRRWSGMPIAATLAGMALMLAARRPAHV